MNTFKEFDKYVRMNNVQEDNVSEAFAEFLYLLSNNEWKGNNE